MPYNYTLRLHTKQVNLSKKILSELIEIFQEEPFAISKYDRVERCKKIFSIENIDDIFLLLKGLIFFKGSNKEFKTTIMVKVDSDSGITWWKFFISSSKELSTESMNKIFIFLKVFNLKQSLIYCFLTADEEYDYMHKHIIYYSEQSRSESRVGVSMQDFSEYLPGIYWLNIFGKELAQSLNLEKIKSIPEVKYIDIGKDVIAFHLDQPINTTKLADRSLKLYNIARYIGETHFFNIVNMEETVFKHPSDFKNYLEKIKEEYEKSRLT